MTWGIQVAQTEFYPPQMYLAIFLIGMPGQYLFGVTPMTMAAIVTTFLCSAVYYAATGIFFFSDSHVPIAVFLGMTLLFTDPATSPRTEVGRVLYGVLYGLTTVVLLRPAAALRHARLLRQAAAGAAAEPVGEAARSGGAGSAAVAGAAAALPGLHERVGGGVRRHERVRVYLGDHHPGQYLPFWQQACAANTRTACEDLYFQEDGYCEDGSAWACNEVGILLAEHYANPRRAVLVRARVPAPVRGRVQQRCDDGDGGSTFKHDPPTLADYRSS
jgi:hypothetical protein